MVIKNANGMTNVVEAAADLFYQQGYFKTSIAQIAQHCGLQKASIYHYINSKQALALSVVQSIHEHFTTHVFCSAYQKDQTAGIRIQTLFAKAEEYYLTRESGCPIGTLTLELASSEKALKKSLQSFFTDWNKSFVHILESRLPSKETQQIAMQTVCTIQGNLVLAKLYDMPVDFSTIEKHLLKLI